MTSRGNQSVSPPAQIPQQRHVNAIPSSTPPPQQYYQGPSSALSQNPYEVFSQPQSQPFISYQAYGSAVSGGPPGNGGRGGPSQQGLSQGSFYQNPGSNIRPQQTHQSHTYFLSTQTQPGIRHSRQSHPPASQQMLYIHGNYPPRNSVITIPTSVYPSPRVPVFQPYVQSTSYPTNIVYYPNGAPAWQNPGMTPTATAPIRQPVREKKVLSIMDPDTGRDITEELFNKSHTSSVEEHHEDVSPVNQNNKTEICQAFTRLVADRLKSPDDSSTPGASSDSHGPAPASSGNVIASQQYHQPPPQQSVQQQPATVASATIMRPPPTIPHHIPPRSGMIQQPPSSTTPSHDIQHQVLNVNLSMPPPQFPLRQPTQQMYNSVPPQQQSQHPAHPAPHHVHPPQQPQTIRPQMPPVIHPQAQVQPQHQSLQHTNSHPSITDPALQSQKAETSVPDKQKLVEATSQDNIPARQSVHLEPATKPSSPVTDVSSASSQSGGDTVTHVKSSSVKMSTDSEEVEKVEDSGKVEASHGGGSQGIKDVRKGKKNKKDFIRKEIGGSDMDAFIDKVDGAYSGAGEVNVTRTNNALELTSEAASSGSTVTGDLELKEEVTLSTKEATSTSILAQRNTPTSEYTKDDSPNPQKNEQQKQPIASAQGQNEAIEIDEMTTLPQSATDRKSSIDKPTLPDVKTLSIPITATQEIPKMTKESLQQPSAPASTAPTQVSEAKVDSKTTTLQQKDKSVTETADTAIPASSASNTRNIGQQPSEPGGGSTRSNSRPSGQTERQNSRPLENGVPEIIHSEPVPAVTKDFTGDSRNNRQVISDENIPPLESISDLKGEDIKNGRSLGSGSETVPTRPSSEKTLNKVKKDSKEKLHYDRAYLMELRESASSQTKPEGLPNLEIILDRPVMNTNRGTGAAPLDFTPAFFQQSSGQRHAPQIGKTNSRNRPRSDVQIPQRVIKSVSLQDSVKPLHQSEKPWKPTQKQLSAGELAEKKKSLESEVLFIMNRLTPTNFERLAQEMRALNINTYDDLQELVKIFFDKVTMETKFVEAYANLCKYMSQLKVQPTPNSGLKESQATFRVVMLTKCQQEFEADKTIVFEDPEEKKKKIEAEMPEGPERIALIENTLYQMKLKRLKFYGNIRFIGELFKLGMLTENIMHDCILRLLKARDDDSLVSLCNLITTVGQTLDTEKAKARMDQYFVQMGKIAEERKSRIKFTLKDAIDLRNNNWVPRKEQTGPKKIDEVHKDFQEEQATKQFLQSQPLLPRNDVQQPSSRRGSRQRQDEKMTDDGWNTVGSKSLRIDASKMKLSKNVVDENSIQLGPGGGLNKFSMWSRGSYGGTQPSQDNERSSAPGNRFSALRGEEDRRNFQRSPSRGDSSVSNRGMRQGPTVGHGRGKILTRSSQEGERRDALASARSIVGRRSQNSSRDNSWNRDDHRQIMGARGSREGDNPMTRSDIILRPGSDSLLPPPSVSPTPTGQAATGFDGVKKVKPLTEEEMEQKAKTILEEYLSVMDLEEAKLCLTELAGQKHLHLLVTASINEVLEKSKKERDLTGSFFHEMVKHGQLPMDIYSKGLADVLRYAEDMVIDIPMIWTYLAQMIVPMLLGGSLPWSALPDVLKPSLGDKYSAKLIAEILLLAKEKTNEDEVALLWQDSNMNWASFLPADEIDRFLKEKKLEFTLGPVSRTSSRVPGYSLVDYQKLTEDIERIVREKGSSSSISTYIDTKVHTEKQDKHFVRALVTALINASISHNTKLNEDAVKSHVDVLNRYIKNDPELELQALYAIQALMHKLEHPSGVIAHIFNMLYDEDVISEESFKSWEKSTDPQELEGKGACSMQLTQFFTWLQENEPETS